MYNRALRSNPELEGEVVFRLRILPEGRVDSCEIAETEINDEQFLDTLCRRLLLLRFEALNVDEARTVTKPIDFTRS